MISPRRDEKGHGIARKIDGVFQPGHTALLVDDLITQAHSKLETIRSLEENGLKVNEVVVLVDREQGGPEQLVAAGYKFYSALKLSDILKFYLDSNKINQEQYQRTIKYLESN
jgi:orotate phosphoribosyltransferase